jgi:hypothetical protein
MCLHEDDRAFIFAKTISFSPFFLVVVGEALGLFHVMQWIHDMQFDNVDFLGDYSKTTTNAFYSNQIDIIEFSHLLQVTGNYFQLNLQTTERSLIGTMQMW